MAEPSSTPTEFEIEVAELFRLLGYEVISQLTVSSKRPDSFVVDRHGVGKPHRILIECKRYTNAKIGPDDFTRFLNLVNNSRHDGLVESGIMVSIHGATPVVLAETQKPTCPVEIITIAELRNKLLNPRAYLNQALSEWRYENATYVNRQGCERSDGATIPDLRSFLLDLATRPGGELVILFGGAGTGKSTQLRQLAIDLASAYLEREDLPVPIYISLLDYSRNIGRSLDRYIFDTLKIFYPEPTPKWLFLKRQIEKRRIAILLDGFDEMKNLYKTKMIVSELINIISVFGTEAKCFMTCRSPIVESEPEIEETFVMRPKRRFPDLNVRILELSPLSPLEAEKYLTLAGKEDLRDKIHSGTIADLCHRPILLNLLIEMYSSRSPRRNLTSEDSIIDESIEFMLENRVETHESSVELSDWRKLLEVCALEMIVTGRSYLDRGRLSEIVVEHLGRELREADVRPAVAHARIRTLFDLGEKGLIFQHLMFRDFLAAFEIAQNLLYPSQASVDLDGLWMNYEVLRYLDSAIRQKLSGAPSARLLKPSNFKKTPLRRGKFCWIPPGLYVTDRSSSGNRGANLKNFPSGFWITKMPLTVSEYRESLSNVTLLYAPEANQHGRLPLTNISFEEAESLAVAAGGRLPTEQEWERAAGWIDGSYPRLAQIPPARPIGIEQPPHVGLTGANPWGFYDATGCVWQWTTTKETATGINIVKGAYWDSSTDRKLNVGERLVPARPRHVRTGMRIVLDDGEG